MTRPRSSTSPLGSEPHDRAGDRGRGGAVGLAWRADLPPLGRLTHDPNALGCYPLVPWSNRISGGGIEAGGRFWPLRPNWPGEPYPIHGDGWRRPWRVERHTEAEIVLTLDSKDAAAVRLPCSADLRAGRRRPDHAAFVVHRGAVPAPYGLGFHPWLPRTPGHAARAAGDRDLAGNGRPHARRQGAGRGAAGLGLRTGAPAAHWLDQQWLRGLDRHGARALARARRCR